MYKTRVCLACTKQKLMPLYLLLLFYLGTTYKEPSRVVIISGILFPEEVGWVVVSSCQIPLLRHIASQKAARALPRALHLSF